MFRILDSCLAAIRLPNHEIPRLDDRNAPTSADAHPYSGIRLPSLPASTKPGNHFWVQWWVVELQLVREVQVAAIADDAQQPQNRNSL